MHKQRHSSAMWVMLLVRNDLRMHLFILMLQNPTVDSSICSPAQVTGSPSKRFHADGHLNTPGLQIDHNPCSEPQIPPSASACLLASSYLYFLRTCQAKYYFISSRVASPAYCNFIFAFLTLCPNTHIHLLPELEVSLIMTS